MENSIGVRLTAWAGAAAMSLTLAGSLAAAAGFVGPEEMQRTDQWVQERLLDAGARHMLLSFVYDGRASDRLLSAWLKKTKTTRLDGDRVQHTLTWIDPVTGLEVRLVAVQYADFPAVEWTVYFKNAGTKNTPILRDIRALDSAFQRSGEGEFVLHGNKGDCRGPENYQPYRHALEPNETRRFAPAGGRPTNGPNGWPYYTVQMPGGGLILAVGWPGQWATAFVRDGTNGLRITAGQELTHLSLKPGEEIRTPLVALLFWQGTDVPRAQNLWRRWFTAHNMPRRNGKLPEPFLTAAGNMGDVKGGESWYRNRIQTVNQAGLDWNLCWIDAGWYPCHGSWEETGTWEIDLTRYPNGFRQLSDALHAQGRKLVVWFEPERVRDPKGWLATQHPKWLLGFGTPEGYKGPPSAYWPQGWDKLLNLGDPAARAWATDHFDRMIKSQGIDIYRQDFNIEPLPYWQRNDAPDRQGITENFYVQGYLAYLDSLLARNPTIWSDVSASGGRRNDLETLRRALPLRRSDYEAPGGSLDAMQAQTHGLSAWLVYYGVLGQTTPLYAARSTYLPALVFPSDFDTSAKALADVKKVFDEYHRVAPLMLCDYYPLTGYSLQPDQWIAWQFDRPEQGDGVVQVFRRDKCPEASRTFRLRGLDAAARYEITDFDAPARREVSGKDLIDKGLPVRINDQPGAAVMAYRRTGAERSSPATVTNSIGMKLAHISAGEFEMGNGRRPEEEIEFFKRYGNEDKPERFQNEYPRHRVRITRSFYLGIHEVTVGQFGRFMREADYRTEAETGQPKGAWRFLPEKGRSAFNADASWRNPGYAQGDEHPVVVVSYNDATAFCAWLSRKEGARYRLPTEAEWEYACRAGTTTRYSSGDDPESLAQVANVFDATAREKLPSGRTIRSSDGYVFTAPVGRFRPNAWGLYDMHGNVWEWCADWYGADYYARSPADDPPGPETGTVRVLRGGAWSEAPWIPRSSFRGHVALTIRAGAYIGFRVARSADGPSH